MKKTVLCLALIYISTSSVHGTNANHLCGDYTWITYKNEKCFKLFKSFEIRNRAEDVCNQQDSKLVTIKSAAEQTFLIEYVFNSSNSNDVWIGAQRRLESSIEFDWNDGSAIQRFTNWAIGRPSDVVSRSCVIMQSILSRGLHDMEWVDVSCTNGNWFICEKIQFWSYEQLQQGILSNKRELEHSIESLTNQITAIRNTLTTQVSQLNSNTNLITDTRNTLNAQGTQINRNKNLITATRNTLTTQGTQVQALQANPVPINFTYVQLPNQPEPWKLWRNVGWSEITSQYAGLFFRAQGGGSAEFGAIQAENSPRLTRVRRVSHSGLNSESTVQANDMFSLGVASGAIGDYNLHWALGFTVSSGEVRPRNKAMRIWMRI